MNDNVNYEELLNSCFEIEGLLSLLRYREGEAPEEVHDLLLEKVAILAHDLGITLAAAEPAAIETPAAPETPVEAAVPAAAAEAAKPTEAIKPEEPAEPASSVEPVIAEAPAEQAEEDMEEADSETRSLTLDRRLAIDGSRDLLSAISLNDKFRFRRELFGNSDAEFMDTINLIQAMRSIDEAEEYLYGDLHWNPEGDDVKDFIAIIRDHFTL